MATVIDRHLGDTSPPLGFNLQRPNGAAVDYTGKTAKFKLVNNAGADVIALTADGVTEVDAENGQVDYDVPAGAIAAAGVYYPYIVLEGADAEDVETFPAKSKAVLLNVQGDV